MRIRAPSTQPPVAPAIEPDEAADHHARRDHDQRREPARAHPVEHPAEHVAADLVGAEHEPAVVGRDERLADGNRSAVRRDPGRGDAHDGHGDQAEDRDPVRVRHPADRGVAQSSPDPRRRVALPADCRFGDGHQAVSSRSSLRVRSIERRRRPSRPPGTRPSDRRGDRARGSTSSVAHVSTAELQRGWNAQPDGGSSGLAGSPASRIDRSRSELGTAPSSAFVYG